VSILIRGFQPLRSHCGTTTMGRVRCSWRPEPAQWRAAPLTCHKWMETPVKRGQPPRATDCGGREPLRQRGDTASLSMPRLAASGQGRLQPRSLSSRPTKLLEQISLAHEAPSPPRHVCRSLGNPPALLWILCTRLPKPRQNTRGHQTPGLATRGRTCDHIATMQRVTGGDGCLTRTGDIAVDQEQRGREGSTRTA
jgi:hypothetical protein